MKQIEDDIVLQAVIEKKDRLQQEKAAMVLEYDKQITELNKYIQDHSANSKPQVDMITYVDNDSSLSGKIIHMLEVKKYGLTNSAIAGATGATGPQVSTALYRMKDKKVLSEGNNKKMMEWGLIDWFDENGKLKDEYRNK